MNLNSLSVLGHPIDEKHLSSNRPEMMVFPDMTHFYTKWKHSLQNRNVNVRLNTRVTSGEFRLSQARGTTPCSLYEDLRI